MGFFSKKKQEITNTPTSKKTKRFSFSVPFLNVQAGTNLSKPYVNNNYGGGSFEFFGADNLYPNYLEQIYYLSPIHNKCIDFSVNSIVGGGFELNNKSSLSGPERLAFETFVKKNKLNAFFNKLVLNYRIHDTFYVEVNLNGSIPSIKVLDCGTVRINPEKNVATISNNWLMRKNLKTLPIYEYGMKEKHFIYMFQNMKIGMSTYPLPFYNSILNDIETDQEIPFFRLSALKNGIFPATVLGIPYEMTDDEQDALTDMLRGKKGVKHINEWFVLTAEGKENLPEVTQLSIANGMDDLFEGTEKSVRNRIITIHNIGTSLVGEQTAGQLGQNQQMLTEWMLYLNNVVNPIRGILETEINDLFDVIIKGYQISLLSPNTEELLSSLIKKEGDVKTQKINE